MPGEMAAVVVAETSKLWLSGGGRRRTCIAVLAVARGGSGGGGGGISKDTNGGGMSGGKLTLSPLSTVAECGVRYERVRRCSSSGCKAISISVEEGAVADGAVVLVLVGREKNRFWRRCRIDRLKELTVKLPKFEKNGQIGF